MRQCTDAHLTPEQPQMGTDGEKLVLSLQIMVDFYACTWPKALDAASPSLAMHFDHMNEEPVADVVTACTNHAASSCRWPPVITFSHFLPLQVSSCYFMPSADLCHTNAGIQAVPFTLLLIHFSSCYRLAAMSKTTAY